MDFQLNDLTRSVQEAVWKWAETTLLPRAHDIDATNTFPKDLWPQLGGLGLLGVTVSSEFGGSDMGYLEHVVVMEQLSRASASLGLSYGAHSNLCVNQIHLNGTQAQKIKYLPKLCSGEHVGALAMSEVGSGSDVVSMQLKAEDKGDHFLLNGSKMWCTNGPDADVLVIYGKSNPDLGPKGITTFIVEKEMPGFSPAQKLDKLGMRGSSTCELVFQDCKVPKENVLGEINGGVRVMMSGLDYERVVLAAGPLGLMTAALELSLTYAKERKQFGQPICDFQLIQAKVADMYMDLNASRAYVYGAARACDQGTITREDAAGVITFAAQRCVQSALECIQILGGNGYINEYAAGRFLRDAKLYEIGAGTNEIRKLLMGREIFKKWN